MNAPLSRTRPIPRRGLSRVEAAIYLGISPSRFDEKRKAGEIPPARRDGDRKLWDVHELDFIEEEPKAAPDPALLIRGVYIVGFDNYVKIGWSNKIHWRLCELQTGAPRKLQIYGFFPGSQLDERRLHRRFHEHRLEGEWFDNRGELADWIAGGCQQ